MTGAVGEYFDLRGKLSAREINSFARDAKGKLEATAANALIPVAMGTVVVPGIISAWGIASPSELYIRVVWCMGSIRSINSVFISGVDQTTNTNIRMRHHRGEAYQESDGWMATVIAGYSDDMRYTTSDGTTGVAYTTFRIPAAELGTAPRFQAIIDGWITNDPDNAQGQNTTDGDPFYDDVGFSVEFTAASPNTTATDDGPNSVAVSFFGNAYVDGQLQLDGAGDYVTIPDSASYEFGSDPFTLEIVCSPTTVTGNDQLFGKAGAAGNRSFYMQRQGTSLLVRASSDGTNWNIFDNTYTSVFALTSPLSQYKITLEFTGHTYWLWINGQPKANKRNTATIFNSSGAWHIGARVTDVTNTWQGSIRAVRFTTGHYRYGCIHAEAALPFADSSTFVTGNGFSDNTARNFAKLVTDPYSGLGSTVSGLADCISWDDELISGSEKRSRISLLIDKPKKTTDWLDYLAEQGEFFYMNDGSGITMTPDKPIGETNPTGRELAENPNFDPGDTSPNADASWTRGTNWNWNPALGGFYTHSPTSPLAYHGLSQSIAGLEVGAEHVITCVIGVQTGNARVMFDGVEVISGVTAAGTYTATVTPTSISPEPVLSLESEGTTWVTELSIKRKYWLNELFLKDSITIDGLDDGDSPTEVTVRYKEDSTTSPDWEEKSQTWTAPGVESGDIPLIPTTINIDSIYRAEEAAIKAESRGRRYQNRTRVTWSTTDIGVVYLRGAVVQVRSTDRGVDCLVVVHSVTMTDYGRYKCSGLIYDESHYPTEASVGGGTVPVGAITPLKAGSSVPSGWAVWSDADTLFLKMWSETTSPHEVPGDTGGSGTFAGFSGNTTTDGAHSTSSTTQFDIIQRTFNSGSPNADITTDDTSSQGSHNHSYSTGSFPPNPYHRRNVMIQKTGTAGSTVPKEALSFGLGTLNISNLTRSLAYQNRILRAESASSNSGSATKTIAFTTGTADDSHDHHSTTNTNATTSSDFDNQVYDPPQSGGGVHDHDYSMAVTRKIKRYKLALYEGSDDFSVGNGLIMFWAGAKEPSPSLNAAGWYICDGTNGTPDLRDYYIEIAAQGSEDTSAGDNTVSISGTGENVGHDHDGSGSIVNVKVRNVAHSNTVVHTHTITDSGSWQPQYYVVYPIMYNGD